MLKPVTAKTSLTPKQRAYLKGLANPISHRYLLGKAEIDEGFLVSIDTALEAKELIKVGLLPSCESKPKEIAEQLESRLNCFTVQIIGRVIVLYRRSRKHPVIELE